eukprot:SAG11_NODE_26303_length_347_cov_0.596774_1_plen_39_part_10
MFWHSRPVGHRMKHKHAIVSSGEFGSIQSAPPQGFLIEH